MVKRLVVRYRADVTVVDSELLTPLHVACANGHAAVAQVLIERGARVEAAARNG